MESLSAQLRSLTHTSAIHTWFPIAYKQTEAYVEYDRTGRIVKGAPKAIAKSKYEEVRHTVNTII
jgi:Pre-mRNA splicing Prp18-interacting factor